MPALVDLEGRANLSCPVTNTQKKLELIRPARLIFQTICPIIGDACRVRIDGRCELLGGLWQGIRDILTFSATD